MMIREPGDLPPTSPVYRPGRADRTVLRSGDTYERRGHADVAGKPARTFSARHFPTASVGVELWLPWKDAMNLRMRNIKAAISAEAAGTQ